MFAMRVLRRGDDNRFDVGSSTRVANRQRARKPKRAVRIAPTFEVGADHFQTGADVVSKTVPTLRGRRMSLAHIAAADNADADFCHRDLP